MNTTGLIIKAPFDPNTDMVRFAAIIEKKGGNIWNEKRAYFGESSNDFVSRVVYAQPYSAYIDLESKEIVFEVNEEDFKTEKNSADDYKKAFINSLKSK